MGKATIKKDMIKAGQLDKYGKPNENTPKNWTSSYVDFNLKTEAVTPKVEGEVTPKVEGGGRGKLQKRAMPLQTRLPRHLRRRLKRRRLQGRQQRRRRRKPRRRPGCCRSYRDNS